MDLETVLRQGADMYLETLMYLSADMDLETVLRARISKRCCDMVPS